MKNSIIYFLTGFIFSIGLAMGGMLDPENIKKFLWVGFPEDWSPLLLIVLATAIVVYSAFYWRQVKCGQSKCGPFAKIPQGKVDRKLLIGSILFGVGWGLAGLCPAPAVARIAIEPTQASTWVFVALMFLGFKANSWIARSK